MMIAVILAAGYGTRLEQDLHNDSSGQYQHLRGVPKPLLPIAGAPLISHWVTTFSQTPQITRIVVVVNQLHKPMYEEWARTLASEVVLVCDGSSSNTERSGAVACMWLGAEPGQQDTLFVAGDTLLLEDFSLQEFLDKFEEKKRQHRGASLVLSAPVLEENVSKHGIIEVGPEDRVRGFLEKPRPGDTTSRLQCPCFYLLSTPALPLLQKFVEDTKDEPLERRDATGTFIARLIHQTAVFAYPVRGRYDVGGLQSYLTCCQHFTQVPH